MTFPLPMGTCRQVCRPKREPPRWATPKAVARMAVAAVKRGADACELVTEVAKAVDCQRCGQEADDLRSLDTELGAAAQELNAAYLALLEVLTGINLKRVPDEDPSWWSRLIRGLRRWLIVKDVVEAILNLVAAFDKFNAALIAQRAAVHDILNCLQGV